MAEADSVAETDVYKFQNDSIGEDGLSRKRDFNVLGLESSTIEVFSGKHVKKHRLHKIIMKDFETNELDPSPARRGPKMSKVFTSCPPKPHFFNPCEASYSTPNSSKSSSWISSPSELSESPRTQFSEKSASLSKGKKVRFKDVDVFLFHRSQSFDTVPSKGGAALGMGEKHHEVKRVSVAEFENLVVKKQDHAMCSPSFPQQDGFLEYNGELSGNLRQESTSSFTADTFFEKSDDSHFISERSCLDLFNTSAFYKSPLDERTRRRILRASGVQVDKADRINCNFIRSSRETCGCSCGDGKCLPSTCECIKEEICCQNERPNFPCSCTAETCSNPNGFVEFNPDRVRSHQTSVFIRLKQFPEYYDVLTPKHLYLEDTRVRSTYLPISFCESEVAKTEISVTNDDSHLKDRSGFGQDEGLSKGKEASFGTRQNNVSNIGLENDFFGNDNASSVEVADGVKCLL